MVHVEFVRADWHRGGVTWDAGRVVATWYVASMGSGVGSVLHEIAAASGADRLHVGCDAGGWYAAAVRDGATTTGRGETPAEALRAVA